MRTLLALLLVLAACKDQPPNAAPAKAMLSRATQADLAQDLDKAAESGTWFDLRRRWQGQKLRWTVIRQQLLCASAEHCNVAAFPIKQAATHGWMPELAFAPGEYDALVAKCGNAPQCEVTFEGTLAKLEASEDTPTRLHFDGVTIARN